MVELLWKFYNRMDDAFKSLKHADYKDKHHMGQASNASNSPSPPESPSTPFNAGPGGAGNKAENSVGVDVNFIAYTAAGTVATVFACLTKSSRTD
uniref:Uncharacterized protein n=1 Tax=Glossina morsitans morsitans TaxID=37546 RepID=A0A1B0FGZ1_GLOMM